MKEWVIIATDRAKRPHDFAQAGESVALPSREASCPFCPGNEAMTPPEVLRIPNPQGAGWGVRVIPNKFAALTGHGEPRRREDGLLFREMDGVGYHEVVVETPIHNRTPSQMDDAEVAAQVLRKTLLALDDALHRPDFNYILHSAPTEDKTNQYYLWHIQILPRVTTIAGFELGSGIYITTVVPEESAAFMRETMARVGPDRPCGTGG
jgi:galactose-1-phosphate uridylyltransferase